MTASRGTHKKRVVPNVHRCQRFSAHCIHPGRLPKSVEFRQGADAQHVPGLQVRGAAPESTTLNRTDRLLEPGDLNGQPLEDLVKKGVKPAIRLVRPSLESREDLSKEKLRLG